MSWPLLRNNRAAARTLGLADFGAAAAIAWLAPLALGAVLYPVSYLLPGDTDAELVLLGIATMLIFSPTISWAGLVPGTLLLAGLLRIGWGGLIVVLVLGFGLGWVISAILGGSTALTLFSVFGVVSSAMSWLALRWRRPTGVTR